MIAWVNPEQLYIDNTATFDDKDSDFHNATTRLVAISKIEEFAAIADGTLDSVLESIPFIERIPVGLYHFSYLVPVDGDEDEAIICDILVYDCMQNAYRDLFDWLPNADLQDERLAAQHINDVLFTETDRLIGYRKQDIVDIISYYKQTEELPEFIRYEDRSKYDVSKLAQHIVDEDMGVIAETEFMKNEFKNSESHWSAFYGINNLKAFRMTIRTEKDRIIDPEGYRPAHIKPITTLEQRQIQDLPLYEIRQKFPELGEKIRMAVFNKFTDADGYYYCAYSGYKSKNRLDFQIDHITPMADGGKTTLENLQLLTRAENMRKGTSNPV